MSAPQFKAFPDKWDWDSIVGKYKCKNTSQITRKYNKLNSLKVVKGMNDEWQKMEDAGRSAEGWLHRTVP